MSFKNTYLSVSRLKTYELCAKQFWHRYVEKSEVNKDDDKTAATFGGLLHEALEIVFKWIVTEEFEGRFPVDKLLDAYKVAWSNSGLKGIDLYAEGVQIMKDFVVAYPVVDHRDVLAVERELNIQIGEFHVKGYIDRVDRIDDKTIRVIDYKSNRLLYTKEEIRGDIQPLVYALAAKIFWPWAEEIQFEYIMLRHNTTQHAAISSELVGYAADYVELLGTQTETDTKYAETLNSLCGYCAYKPLCGTYEKALSEGHPFATETPEDLVELSKERESVANVAKIAYARKAILDKVIKKKLTEQDSVDVNGMCYRMTRASENAYPIDSVVAILSKAGLDPQDLRERMAFVSKPVVDFELKKLNKKMSKPEYRMLVASVNAVAKTTVTQRMYAKSNKTVEDKAKAVKKKVTKKKVTKKGKKKIAKATA